MSDHRFEPGQDPCALFFKGFSNAVKPSEISDYFHDKGYPNRITYQKSYSQYFRLFMALRFDNNEIAQEVCQKYSNTIIFGYKIHLSFFQKKLGRLNNNIFMKDKLRKLRAQATRRPFIFRNRFHSHYSPARTFKSRSRRRSRSSSSDSDRSNSPDRKRRARSRDSSDSKRRRHHSRSHSRSSRSTSRSRTPTRFSPSSNNSKRSTSSTDCSSTDHVRKVCSKVTVVGNTPKKFSNSLCSSKECSQELGSPMKAKQGMLSPNKEHLMSNFSPVSFGSEDDAMLMTPTAERVVQAGTNQKEPSEQSVGSYFSLQKSGPTTEVWMNSEGDSTPDGGTPSPRGPGLSPRRPKQSHKQSHSVYGTFGTFTEIKGIDRPWQLKPLTTSASATNNKQTETAYSSNIKSPSSLNSTGSPSSYRLQSPTSSFGASPPKVNGARKQGQTNGKELNQTKLEELQAKKEEIIRAYKQDCDTFATVVRMLIRKDHELEHRLQLALRENLTEIGQHCVQELQDMVEQIKD